MTDFVRGLKCRLLRQTLSQRSPQLLHRRFRPARSRLRLRGHRPRTSSRQDRKAAASTCGAIRELLPLDGEPTVGPQVGGTPLVRADRLADALGVERLWIKNDAVNFPTLSFKDRVVSVALSKAREFGFRPSAAPRPATWPTASPPTPPPPGWKLTSSSQPIWSGPRSSAPASTEPRSSASPAPTTRSTASARRSPSSTAGASSTSTCGRSTRKAPRRWASRSPSNSAGASRSTSSCPMAGGSLIGKIYKAFDELHKVGLIGERRDCKMYGAQATGCNPITDAVKNRPRTPHARSASRTRSAKSLAIGDPADGFFAAKLMRDTGGWAEDVERRRKSSRR